jgi:hypothetical protein
MKLLLKILIGMALFVFGLKGLKLDASSIFHWFMLILGLAILFVKPLGSNHSSAVYLDSLSDSDGGSGGDCGGDGGGCD